jgi:2-polyprenyl-3-methyl-5-hydroxy-6-metoxy-1,4-benzoquinol methylase
MVPREDLDLVTEIYSNDPFEVENAIHGGNYVSKCMQYAEDRSSWLELGLGRGIVLQHLSQNFRSVRVLDGSPLLVERYSGMYPNVDITLSFFEDYSVDEQFMNIGMGFILEHVDDPAVILQRFRKMLMPGGRIFVGVPSASSLHRLLAVDAGLLGDLRAMSDSDRRFGHKRFFTHQDWMALFQDLKMRVVRAEGLYLKPFSTGQIQSLNLPKPVYRALGALATDLPQISNACFYLLANE